MLDPIAAASPPDVRAHPLRVGWSVAWRVFVFFVLWGTLTALVVVPLVLGSVPWAPRDSLRSQILAEAGIAAAILLATWLMLRFLDRRPFAEVGLAPRRAWRALPVGIGLGVAWMAASLGAAWLAGCLRPAPTGRFSAAALVGMAVALACNALSQQLLLCGYVLQTLRTRVGLPWALVLSAALFSLYHAPAFGHAWLPALNVFAAGLLFGLAWRVSGSLWLPVGIHFAWNVLLGPALGMTVSGLARFGHGWRVFDLGGPALLSGGSFGLEGGLPVTLTTAIGIAALAWRARRLR